MNTGKNLTQNTPSTPNTPATIGERIRALRLRKGVTQQVVADFTYVDKATICRWEKGEREPSLRDIRRLADYFEVSDAYIIYGPVEARSDMLDMSGIPFSQRSLLEKLAEVLRGN